MDENIDDSTLTTYSCHLSFPNCSLILIRYFVDKKITYENSLARYANTEKLLVGKNVIFKLILFFRNWSFQHEFNNVRAKGRKNWKRRKN